MTTAVGSAPRTTATGQAHSGQEVADVFVIFGITGDLAKVMTFHSLYRLEQRGLLSCPIVGVAVSDWSAEDLRSHARAAIESTAASRSTRRVFDRLAARMSYVSGDFGDAATYERVAPRDRRREVPGVLSRDPAVPVRPRDQGPDRRGVDEDRAGRGREAVRPRSRVGSRAGGGDPPVHRRVPALPDRSLPGEDGARRVPVPAVRELEPRAGVEPQPHRRASRSRWPRASASRIAAISTTRRRAARRGREPPDAAARRGGDGAAGIRRPASCGSRPRLGARRPGRESGRDPRRRSSRPWWSGRATRSCGSHRLEHAVANRRYRISPSPILPRR